MVCLETDYKDKSKAFGLAFWRADNVFVDLFIGSMKPLGCPSHTWREICWSVSQMGLLGPSSCATDEYIEALAG